MWPDGVSPSTEVRIEAKFAGQVAEIHERVFMEHHIALCWPLKNNIIKVFLNVSRVFGNLDSSKKCES